MSTILIVDDDRNTRDGLERALKSRHNVFTAPDARTALQIHSANPLDVILSDVRMPGLTGLEFLAEVRASHPATPFILLTAYGSVETAVEAMKAGAYDFLTKPVNLDHLDILVERAVAERALRARAGELQSQNASLRRQLDEKFGMENIIGSSAAMKPVFDTIRAAAPTSATVLVTGPSGTGKELVAHAIHNLSRRSSGPFVAVNCAALPASLLESELFGHEKGAFTGADTRRKGRFELASGGTLFLDEIGEIDQATQVKLLRVLEDRRFERVGGTETVEADFRLVAATNKDLPALVSAGAFREDLFYRLSVIDIRIPPLAERADDIPALTMAFLKEFAEKNGKDVRAIAPEALDALCLYPWPGNVRELRNTIERMVVLASGDTLGLSDIPQRMRAAPTG
ncbi:MAG: sigma-54-dependent Fis family transcriptional regulator, partial [Kiritimatiellae bacterium]|nr:sigma-54-dependent Fis family transcriptional regulator [Kiritimatiellia bacterium]